MVTLSTIADVFLLLLLFLFGLNIHYWFWKTRESSFAPMMFIVAVPVSLLEFGWPVWFRWVFRFALFGANTGFSIWMYQNGYRGCLARRAQPTDKP